MASLITSALSEAQTTGTISGYVTDPTGAAVQRGTVTAKLVDQNVVRTVQSNIAGFYVFNALPPGTYTVATEASGFQQSVRSGITLTVNQNVRVDIQLKLGQVTQVLEITGEAPLVDTTSGTISGLVDGRRVIDLPLNGRNILALARTVAGVQNVKAPQYLANACDGAIMNVNGGAQFMPNTGALKREHAGRADMIKEFFNTEVFVPTDEVPRGTYGNSGRNILSGPASANTALAIMKDFPVTEKLRMQFRSEFFDAFNQVNFSNPNSEVNSSAFGKIRSAGTAREIQFALKLMW